MKRPTMIAVLICLLALLAVTQFGQAQTTVPSRGKVASSYSVPDSLNNEPETQTRLLQRLTVEVRKLRSELLEQRLEAQELKLTLLKRELEQARAKQQQLEEEEQALSQEVAELDKQLSQSTLTTEDREQLETAKTELDGGRLERLRAERQKVTEQKAQLLELLVRAEQRWQELSERTRELKAVL